MSGGPVSFGSYEFTYVQDWRRNFGDKRRGQVTLPGASGAYNPHGDLYSPAQPGRAEVAFKLAADDREDMDALRDAVHALRWLGLQQLLFQPTDPLEGSRFCWAEVESISMPENKAEHSDLIQNVSIVFNVPDPRLFGDSQATWVIGDGSDIGDGGLVIGSGGDDHAVSGLTTQIAVTNNGNTPTIPTISIIPGGGNTCSNPRVERVESGFIRDFVEYSGALADTDELYLNGKTHVAQVNAVDAWDDLNYGHASFLVLMPGENTINVDMGDAGDDATVTFYFHDTWS